MIVNRACDRERTCVGRGKKRVVYLYLFPSLVRLVESSPFHLQPRYQPVHTRVTYVTVADWHVCLVTVSRFPPRTLLRYTFLRAVEKRVERERGRKRESRVASPSLALSLSRTLTFERDVHRYTRARDGDRERKTVARMHGRVVHRMTWRMSQLVEESFRENSSRNFLARKYLYKSFFLFLFLPSSRRRLEIEKINLIFIRFLLEGVEGEVRFLPAYFW